MAKINVIEREINGRSVGEVGNDEGVGRSTVFVHHNQIGDVVRSACLSQFFHDIVSSIDTMGIREDESQFLRSGYVLFQRRY